LSAPELNWGVWEVPIPNTTCAIVVPLSQTLPSAGMTFAGL
jgi:hypothetical protein